MNKLIFLIITTLCLIALIFASYIIEGNYYMSDYYDLSEMLQKEVDSGAFSEAMPLDEYISYVQRDVDPEFTGPEQYPVEFQYMEAKSFLLRIFCFVVLLALSIIAGFVIKSNRIDLSVMTLDSSEKGVNIARIALYIMIVMVSYITSKTYPFNFLAGWIPTVLWILNLIIIMIWILNLIYAIREKKYYKNKSLKSSGSL